MKVLLSVISFVSVVNLVITNVRSDTVNCKVIPFETKEGLTGTCCVFFKNSANPNAPFPKEEVMKQILDNKDGEKKPKINSSEQSGNKNDDKVVFMDGRPNEPKETVPRKMDGNTKEKEAPENVTLKNKNAFDIPNRCPQGMMRDHSGSCTEPL